MKLKSVKICNFKRFSDLTVQKLPESARLIVLVGPNGCGKSSFFDALHTWSAGHSQRLREWNIDYHCKAGSPETVSWVDQIPELKFHESASSEHSEIRKYFYFRSAYRNEPSFRTTELRSKVNMTDEMTVARMIDNDITVKNNYERLVSSGIKELFTTGPENTTFKQFRQDCIGEIDKFMQKLFDDLSLSGVGEPLEDGTFQFDKGISKAFNYQNLSGGEKASFDLILDIIIKRKAYSDTIYCIDEPEAHMNAQLQASLLSVLCDIIPPKCQLIVATHSVGMLRRARDIAKKNPGSVAFLNFGGLDFDCTQTIEPEVPNRTFWSKVNEVALDDLAALVAPERVVFCEGQPKTSNSIHNYSHDAQCYDQIFKTEFPETKFVSIGSNIQVEEDWLGLSNILTSLVNGLDIIRVIDRDDNSVQQIKEKRKNGVRVLMRRNLESYLFDDEVLAQLAESVNKSNILPKLLEEKKRVVSGLTGAKDDLKKASGGIYKVCKNTLGLTQVGNDAKAFMRDTLAPLVQPKMVVYKELKRDIFDL